MKIKKRGLAILMALAMTIVASVPAFAAEPESNVGEAYVSEPVAIQPRGVDYGGQSGYYANQFYVDLKSGGTNGSAVFGLYTNNASDRVSVSVYYESVLSTRLVASATLTANNGAEQTIYFNAGKQAPAGRYIVVYNCLTSPLNPINCWICSWS